MCCVEEYSSWLDPLCLHCTQARSSSYPTSTQPRPLTWKNQVPNTPPLPSGSFPPRLGWCHFMRLICHLILLSLQLLLGLKVIIFYCWEQIMLHSCQISSGRRLGQGGSTFLLITSDKFTQDTFCAFHRLNPWISLTLFCPQTIMNYWKIKEKFNSFSYLNR